jgi:hypothetical protein
MQIFFAYSKIYYYLCKPKEKHNAGNETKTHTTLCFTLFDVEVVQSAELRQQIATKITQMHDLYK